VSEASPTSDTPKVAVVLLNWNGIADTTECLESLRAVDYPDFDVVVVDNASGNHEADTIAARFPQAHVVTNSENLGFTGGCNQGIRFARERGARYVLLLNNDTIVTPGFLRDLVAFAQRTPDAGFVSSVICYPGGDRIWFAGGRVVFGMIRHVHKGKSRSEIELATRPFVTDYVPGCVMLVPLRLIDTIGELDERYFAYYEDLDWCLKGREHGAFAYVVPDALVYHKKSGSTSEGGSKRFNAIPAYYIARNGVFLSDHYRSWSKIGFYLTQVLVKAPLTLLLLVRFRVWPSYLRGLRDGLLRRATGRMGGSGTAAASAASRRAAQEEIGKP
jgi:GT2 family glycosyltransferase